MQRDDTDILIAGGGVAGLAAAAVFGAAGFRVVCVDPAAPVTDAAGPGADLRTTAILQPGRDLLERAGLWAALAPKAADLRVMRIADATREPPVLRDFDAADISDQPFGWNLPNWLLRRVFLDRIAGLDNVDFHPGVGFSGVLVRTETALVTLDDGRRIRARLLIGADGRDSAVRRAAGIGVSTTRYGQKALSFAVTHAAPHDNVSTEVHRSGGPFTLVPLPDHAGRPCSSVVWMERGPEALRLAALPDAAFAEAATARSAGLYGDLTLVGRRQVWPIISQCADRMAGDRIALMAEAAHVMPPIGAQGLNMSLADLACLADLASASPDRLGDAEMLAAYQRRRYPDVRLRIAGVDALNRASLAGAPLLHDLRARGIGAIHDIAPLRRGLMRLGLGVVQST